MAKNHRTHNRIKQQAQTTAMSLTHAYIVGGGAGANYNPFSHIAPMDDLEEDNICPVCESECTCDNRRQTATQIPNHPQPQPQTPTQSSAGPALEPTSTHQSLKIKLTLPPSLQAQNKQPKKKSKSHTQTTSGSANGGGRDSDSPPIQKKRGRPTKADIAAREAARQATVVAASNEFLDNGGNVDSSRQTRKPKQRQQLGKPVRASQQRKTKKQYTIIEDDEESSELSELDSNSDEETAIKFPTFIPAFSTTSNSSEDSSLDESESDSGNEEKEKVIHPDETFAQETARLRKEMLDCPDQSRGRWNHRNNWEIRPRKKSVGADGKSDAGVDLDSGEETQEDDEEEEEEEEPDGGYEQFEEMQEDTEDQETEDANPSKMRRLMRYAGVGTGWTDDDDSEVDAELFFANLSDSSADGSDDDQMGDIEEGFGDDDMDVPDDDDTDDAHLNQTNFNALTLSEVAAAGFLAPFEDLQRHGVENLPFDAHGWDGHFLFSGGLKDGEGILDIDFDVSSTRDYLDPQSIAAIIDGIDDADIMMATSEEEEAVELLEAENGDVEIVEIFDDSDDGDTTEDEYVDVDGVATPRKLVLLRFPASLGAIDPMSTVSSPVISPESRGRKPLPPVSKAAHPLRKPADILAGRIRIHDMAVDNVTEATAKAPSRAPPMGSFATQEVDKKKRVVISATGNANGGELPPSPFPAIRRLRKRRSGSFNGLSHSGSEKGSTGSRPSSLLSSSRSPYQSFAVPDFSAPDDESNEVPTSELIKLDDVLDTAFLDAETDGETSKVRDALPDSCTSMSGESDTDAHKHIQSLHRWDRIPMDAFRRMQAAANNALTINSPAARRAPRPADGFSYGSTPGGLLRGNAMSTTLFEGGKDDEVTGGRNKQGGKAQGKNAHRGVIISPVILPIRDGDRTPTNERYHQYQQNYLGFGQNSHFLPPAHIVKSRKEIRKEKKRNRKFFGSPASHHLHNTRHHFPNARSRSTSHMQRTNIFASSVPPLSI